MSSALLLTLMSPDSILRVGHLPPTFSLVMVYGVLLGGCLVWLLLQLLLTLRARTFARRAEASYAGEAPLQPGPAVLYGEVEYAVTEERAVRLEVDQDGVEREDSGNWTTRWTEVDRRVMAAPFYLRLPSRERVRVEPTEAVHLVDDMEGVIRVNRARRTRVAELTPGEKIYAAGELAEGRDPEAGTGGYRDTPTALVLGGAPGKPLYLSSRPLGEGLRRQARFDGRSALVILVTAALFQLLLSGYHRRLWSGHDATAEVVSLRHYTTTANDGDTSHHYEVTASSEGVADALVDEVGRDDFASLSKGKVVPWRLVPGSPECAAIGRGATISGLIFLPAALLVTGFVVFYVMRRRRKPWYEQSRVVDRHDGRLPEGFRRRR